MVTRIQRIKTVRFHLRRAAQLLPQAALSATLRNLIIRMTNEINKKDALEKRRLALQTRARRRLKK